MATVTRATDPLPVSGAAIIAAPIKDQFNYILSFLEGPNIDEANVDLTGTDGIVGKSTAQTITGLKSLENTAAGGGGIRTLLNINLNPSSTAQDNDGVEILFKGDDDGGAVTTFGEIECVFTDVSATTEDAQIKFNVIRAGTIFTCLTLDSQNTHFYVQGQPGDGRLIIEQTYGTQSLDLDLRVPASSNINRLNFRQGTGDGTAGNQKWLIGNLAEHLFGVYTHDTDGSATADNILYVMDGTDDWIVTGNFQPEADAGGTLGTATYRWGTLYVDTLGDSAQTMTMGARTLTFPNYDNSTGSGPGILIGINSNGSTPSAGYIKMTDKGGTDYYVWVDDTGDLRIHTSAPTNAGDLAGTVVGAQTA